MGGGREREWFEIFAVSQICTLCGDHFSAASCCTGIGEELVLRCGIWFAHWRKNRPQRNDSEWKKMSVLWLSKFPEKWIQRNKFNFVTVEIFKCVMNKRLCECLILLLWFTAGKAWCLPGRTDKDRKESEVHSVRGRGGRTTGSDEEGERQPRGLDHLHTWQEWETCTHTLQTQ